MVFQDWRDGKFRKLPLPPTDATGIAQFMSELGQSMAALQHHYNDETTAILANLQTQTKDLPSMCIDINEILTIARTVLNNQREAMKYGIPMRKQRDE